MIDLVREARIVALMQDKIEVPTIFESQRPEIEQVQKKFVSTIEHMQAQNGIGPVVPKK